MAKKGQVTSLIRTILIVVVILLVIFFGYKGITSVGKASDNSKLVKFKVQLENAVQKFERNMESADQFDFNLPDYVTEVCFVNVAKREECLYNDTFNYEHVNNILIRDSLESGSDDNVFIFKDETIVDSYHVGKLWPKYCPPYRCFKILEGHLATNIEGLAGFALIEDQNEDGEICTPKDEAPPHSACNEETINTTERQNMNAFCFTKFCYDFYMVSGAPGMDGTIASVTDHNRARISETGFNPAGYRVYFEDYHDFDCNDGTFDVVVTEGAIDTIDISCFDAETAAFDQIYISISTNGFPISSVIVNPTPYTGISTYDALEAEEGILLWDSTHGACQTPYYREAGDLTGPLTISINH